MSETNGNSPAPRFRTQYRDAIVPALQAEFGYPNPMRVPRLTKIVLNMGCGEASRDQKLLARAEEDLGLIAGQKCRRNVSRVSVSQFKLREGMIVGLSVTLRRDRMYEFLERLISTAIPRIRDFRGLRADSFDGRGNYSFGLKEHQIFLELDSSKEMVQLGMDVTLVTTARTDAECRALLKGFGFPLRESGEKN